MRRVPLILLSLCFFSHSFAQKNELSALRIENARLHQIIDSLKRNNQEPDEVLDTWSSLDNIWDDTELVDLVSGPQSSSEDSYLHSRILATMPVMQIPWNEEIRKYIEYYTTGGHRRSMPVILGRWERYHPHFKAIFSRFDIPDEIIALCVVESAVSPRARSGAGAVGVWQFMRETAAGYNIRINEDVDERMDINKSTIAAAKYLSNAYKQFGRWDLAVLSYNCGAGNINKAIIRSGGKRDLWSIYDYLPKETKGYLPSLIAANYVIAYHDELGIAVRKSAIPVDKVVLVTTNTLLADIAQAGKTTVDYLHRSNPHILGPIVPEGCLLMVPQKGFEQIAGMFK